MIVCVLLCHCLCFTFYISFAPGPRKKPNLYVLLIDIPLNHSTLQSKLILFASNSYSLQPSFISNLPTVTGKCALQQCLMMSEWEASGWMSKRVFKRKFYMYKSWPHSHHWPQKWREGPLCSLTCSLPSAASKILQSRKYCRFEEWLLHPFWAIVLGGKVSVPGGLGPHRLRPVCFLWHFCRSEASKLL